MSKKTRDYADANVFMRPFEIYRAALYNVYGGSRVTDVPYIYNNIWIASVCLVYVGLAQARPNYSVAGTPSTKSWVPVPVYVSHSVAFNIYM